MNWYGRSIFCGISLLALVVVGNLVLSALAQPTGSAKYEVYRCQHKQAAEVEKLLTDLLPAEADVHVVSDAKSNSLLIRGSREVQEAAKGLLQQVDRPSRKTDKSIVRSYSVNPAQLDAQVRAIREFCADRREVRITATPETGQIFVLAPPTVQEQIQPFLSRSVPLPATGAARPDRGGAATAARADSSQADAGPTVERWLPVRSGKVQQLEKSLLALFGRRLETGRQQDRPQQDRPTYLLPLESGQVVEFQFDVQRRAILARGSQAIVQQFAELVDALDAKRDLGYRTRALRIERTAPSQVQQAVEAIRGGTPRRSSLGFPEQGDQSRQSRNAGRGGVRLVNYLFQEGQAAAGGSGEGQEPGDMSTMASGPGLQDLEIQTLPDLDVIIVRGRDQDVEQFEQIIRELERLSIETRPKIQIYFLKHTLGESVKEIVDEVQTDLVGGRQGRVTITVLGKPNALLLIGWGEAVDSIIELIQKLDRPVAPESQFSVFALKYAAADVVDQTIDDFFSNRPAMGPDVQTAVDDRTNTLIVYASPRDMLEVQRLVQTLDVARSESVNQAKIFELHNTLATDIAQILQQAIADASAGQAGRSAVLEFMTVNDQGQEVLESGMLDEVSITPNPRNNTLIITGPKEAMGLVGAFIRQLDQPGDRAQIKIFRVINGDATNLVQMLRSLIPSQVGQALGPQLPSAPEEDSLVPLRFSVEVRSNSIIAVGSEGDLRLVEALLTRLDESESMNRRNAVYLLKNAPAVEVASTVNEFLQSQRTLAAAEPGQANPFQDLEREVIVVPEPVGNRLVVSATPRYFDEITQLIEKLDEPPPQVMIQVLIAEVTLNDLDELGFELGLQDSVLFDRSLLDELLTTTTTTQTSDPSGIVTTTEEIVQAATNTPGFNFNSRETANSGADKSLATATNLGGQALSNFALGRASSNLDFGGLVLSASSQNVSVLIRALQETRQIRILSRPTVRTLDNQPAFIQVGQRVPRIVGSTVNQNGQSNIVDLENVGLILGVTPRISPEGNVVMEIDAEKSKVGPEDEGIPISVSFDGTIVRSPRVDTVTAQATVSAADKETVVLGGMIETERETVQRRAPYLADIPILGHLFRFDSEQERRMELLIILTPHVIRNPEDGEAIKQAEFARMNWCAADVYDIYGDVGIEFQSEVALPVDNHCTTEIIYPHLNPRGVAEPQGQPEPAAEWPQQELPPLPDRNMPWPQEGPQEETLPPNWGRDPQPSGQLVPEQSRQPLMPPRPTQPQSNAWQPPDMGTGSQPRLSSRPIRQPTPPGRAPSTDTEHDGTQLHYRPERYPPAPTNGHMN